MAALVRGLPRRSGGGACPPRRPVARGCQESGEAHLPAVSGSRDGRPTALAGGAVDADGRAARQAARQHVETKGARRVRAGGAARFVVAVPRGLHAGLSNAARSVGRSARGEEESLMQYDLASSSWDDDELNA